PQLKGITIGGAVAGLGIESSCFRYGLVHETVLELEVLLASGDIVICTADNGYRDLFFAFPNSYGTLGYALRVKAKTVPAKPFVRLRHLQFAYSGDFFRALERHCAPDSGNDFVDGVIFSPNLYILTLGRFVDECGAPSDYTFMNIYYRSLTARDSDCLTTLGYIWRWDTDWFWCSRVLGAQNPILRRLLGRSRLNSRFYKKIVGWNDRIGLRQRLRNIGGVAQETIIQDVDVPAAKARDFADFYFSEISLFPLWICPFRSLIPGRQFTLFPIETNALYVNFGFWDAKTTKTKFPEGHFNRLIEQEIIRLGGTKSLYSDSFFTPEEFSRLYNGEAYGAIKRKYDPEGRLPDLYGKCVLGQ
ncbi:MAG TPA: FAD-binding oxidoreductase, partial [Hyphomicrobiales bacterium]|nr:FAD-binding oxidoreductase [Hyphomicrobiales bacterium]